MVLRRSRSAGPVSALGAALLLVLGPAAAPAAADGSPHREFTVQDARITESSGLAASHRHPGVYWTHNDSDDGPYVFAVDSQGRTVATVTLRGVTLRDAEAIALGPDNQLYLADIGDNFNGKWPEVWIYRFAEPAQLGDQTVQATRYRVRYADGPRDAEALLVHPVTGRVYIASKSDKDQGHLYQGPETLSTTAVNTFTGIADVPWVTDGGFSPDGTEVVLRGYFWAKLYDWKDGNITAPRSVSVPFQRQGESVTFAADGGSLLFGSEGKQSEVWRVPLGRPTPSPTPTPPHASPSPSPAAPAAAPEPRNEPNHAGALLLAIAAVGALFLWRRGRTSD
ncbi:hypothetical protein KCMC57_up02490 [Kitasatospora sp. CMC57]|uniref:WD40 repeat domain-containing protein n=1 Tax=Kitasatospora sp. CMC57 TaxID=3231513 RepID=A0AB33JM19_9ACTN